jgi:tetratricopeptide (TPR) repeat protein
MPNQEDIEQQRQLLAIYRRNLAHLLQQAAQYGGVVFSPPETANGIAEARTGISQLKGILRERGISVEDEPNDDAPLPVGTEQIERQFEDIDKPIETQLRELVAQQWKLRHERSRLVDRLVAVSQESNSLGARVSLLLRTWMGKLHLPQPSEHSKLGHNQQTEANLHKIIEKIDDELKDLEVGIKTIKEDKEDIEAQIQYADCPLPEKRHIVHPHYLQVNFTGRLNERQQLTAWLYSSSPVLAITGLGGMGKSTLAWAWVHRDLLGQPLPGVLNETSNTSHNYHISQDRYPIGIFWWSFYETGANFNEFINNTLSYASGHKLSHNHFTSMHKKLSALYYLLEQRRILFVLDGFERELKAYSSPSAVYQGDSIPDDIDRNFRACVDQYASSFIKWATTLPPTGSCFILTSRLSPQDLDDLAGCQRLHLSEFSTEDAIKFLRAQGIRGTRYELEEACERYGSHPLALRLLSGMINLDHSKPHDIAIAKQYDVLPKLIPHERHHHVLALAYDALHPLLRELLSRVAAFRSPVDYDALKAISPFADEQVLIIGWRELIERGLILYNSDINRSELHPIVRQYAYERLGDKEATHVDLRNYFALVPTPTRVKRIEDLTSAIELYHHTVQAQLYPSAVALLRDRISVPLYYQFSAYQKYRSLLSEIVPNEDIVFDEYTWASMSDKAWLAGEAAKLYGVLGQPIAAAAMYKQQILFTSDREKAFASYNLGKYLIELGNLRRARRFLADSAVIFNRDFHLDRREDDTWREISRLWSIRGDYKESKDILDKLYTNHRNAHDLRGQFEDVLGYIMFYIRLDATSAFMYTKKLQELLQKDTEGILFTERDFIRVKWLTGSSIIVLLNPKKHQINLSSDHSDYKVHSILNKYVDEAELQLNEAIRQCRLAGLIEMEADILLSLAKWHELKGDIKLSLFIAEDAHSIANRRNYKLKEAETKLFIATLHKSLGDYESAATYSKEAYDIAMCDGTPDHYRKIMEDAEKIFKELRR